MSLEMITELLNKQKMVEGLVHGQTMPRHALVETIVHRQHLAELESLLARLPTTETGRILAALPAEDAIQIWKLIPEERENEILWEISDDLRKQLTGSKKPDHSESQVSAFELLEGRLMEVTISSGSDLKNINPIWIDLLKASKAVRAYIGQHYGVELPDPGESNDLEVSSRFLVEESGEIRLHSNFLLDHKDYSRSIPVALIRHGNVLFSLRNEDLPVFRQQKHRARTQPDYVSDSTDVLLDLYGANVEYSADSLQEIYVSLRKMGRKVLSEKMSDEEAAAMLADIAKEEDLNGRIRSDILDSDRALSFLMRSKTLSQSQFNDAKQILRDIESLNSHTAFLFEKINFLMDATIGFININQNRRVSQFTMFGLVFIPLNILAGIGGMSEYSMMTKDIPWPIAYGAFIISIGLIGWGTFVALKYVQNRKIKNMAKIA